MRKDDAAGRDCIPRARLAARPQVDVVNSPGVLEAVHGGTAEIGFVEGLNPLDDLDALVVHRDEIVVVVDSAHPGPGGERFARAISRRGAT